MKCDYKCDICDGEDTCLACKDPYYLIKQKCVDMCPEKGYFPNNSYLENSSTCDKCDKKCETCDNSKTCIKCAEKYFKHNLICVTECPKPKLANSISRNCEGCDYNYYDDGKVC